jgi:hypothetical protein
VAALAAAAVLGAALLVRARRRAKWEAQFRSALEEVRWFNDELLPQLQQSTSPVEVAGGWRVGAPRVERVEDQLTGLASTAPGEERTARAQDLRDAVRAARQEVDDLVATGGTSTDADTLRAAASRLANALARGDAQ